MTATISTTSQQLKYRLYEDMPARITLYWRLVEADDLSWGPRCWILEISVDQHRWLFSTSWADRPTDEAMRKHLGFAQQALHLVARRVELRRVELTRVN